ncbi:E3 ubiquitin-protein ligase RHA2A-like [Panicum miliaceum]|uniref:E3 ubiquitin-protein ligase RHA2A-like n=1 Tax=Panicum miliaceum TaxID=4540 RepID=A0A3L6S4C3_PANMI|nr:E3 ubiquitin-protein ligase RHA2A-like [Panicum miliaceum]
MGLSSGLHDVSSAAPLPLLLLASLASALAALFSVVSSRGAGANPNTTISSSVRISGLDALVALADCLAASNVCTADGATAAAAGYCTVCLSAIAEGERVRTLACRHAFHAACLDGWFDQSSLPCPLCRAGPAARDDDARRRSAGEDAVSWFARF